MKTALAKDSSVEVQAGPDSPKEALCPDCGNPVELQHFHRNGNKYWYYRHRYGEKCGERQETTSERGRRPETALVTGPPFLVLAVESVSRAIVAARQGDLQALLSLAFNPLVQRTLSSLDIDPKTVLEAIVPPGCDQLAEVIVVHHEPEQFLDTFDDHPGPVFDLHPALDDLPETLTQSPWYIPLFESPPTQAWRIRLILRQADRVYLLGQQEEWNRSFKSKHLQGGFYAV